MMNDFSELYKRIEYLRNNGTKMKEIADCGNGSGAYCHRSIRPSCPPILNRPKQCRRKRRFDQALSLVNNVSKRKLLSGLKTR